MSERKVISNSLNVNTIEDAIYAELTNSMDGVSCDKDGKTGSSEQTVSTYVSLYVGETKRTLTSITVKIAGVTIGTSYGSTESSVTYYYKKSQTLSSGFLTITVRGGTTITSKTDVDITVTDGTNTKTVTLTIAALKQGNTGIQGKMSRNIYFAGMLEEVGGNSFTATDYSAPYVNIGTVDVPECYVYIGENATTIFPTSAASYRGSGAPWEAMTSSFNYLITKALFSEFASLGSAIFNQDFMMSRYGSIVAYGRTYSPANANLYMYADPTDMGARSVSRMPRSVTSSTFNNSSYNETQKISLSLSSGFIYMLAAKFTIASGNTVAFKFAASASGANLLNNGTEYTLTNSDSNIWQYKYKQVTTESMAGSYNLYYRISGGTTATLVDAYRSTAKMRPNIYADWLKGFFYAQNGMFRNVVIEGVMNNLITEIDCDNGVNSDLILSYTTESETRYCLDVLRCGNIVRLKSLPSGLLDGSSSTNKFLYLPFFVSSSNNSRTYTKLGSDGTILSSARAMTADEMKMLIGRKMVFISTITDSAYAYTYLTNHMYVPKELSSSSPASSSLRQSIIDLANGQSVVNVSSGITRVDVNVGTPKTVFLECKMVRDTYNSQYCYIWTQNAAYSSYSDNNGIDETWT